MDRVPIFQEIAESIRQDILYGALEPGDELPTVREMAKKWDCAPGTVLRAYQELAEQGLIDSRPGAGTRVAASALTVPQTPLRRAALVNQAEAFLLGAMSAGYAVEEVEAAVQMALDRWRAATSTVNARPSHELRFVGSHDPALALLAGRFAELSPGTTLKLSFAGSLGGIMALAQSQADIAGAHLLDVETGTYNSAFVRRLLPGRQVALLRLADRRVGLIVAPGNPLSLHTLADLTREGVRFINRQPGAGTRVWLDARLHQLGISPAQIDGYETEVMTHSEVAGAVGGGHADVGLGIEAAALTYGLGFVRLATEHYDIVVPEEIWEEQPVRQLTAEVASGETKAAIMALGGYDTANTGAVEWVL